MERKKPRSRFSEPKVAPHKRAAESPALTGERERLEAALQAAKEHQAVLINSSLDMIISVDMNRCVTEFNRSAEQTLGYNRAEVLGKPVDVLYADPAQGRRVHATVVRDGRFTGEITNKRKSGEVFPVYLSASAMRDQNGRLVGFMGISRDITDRKALEQQRAEFLTILTHDIKNPLGSILAYAEMALEEVEEQGSAQQKDLLEKLQSSVLTLDFLVTNYLDFSKIETGHLPLAKTPFPIQDVLRRVGQQYEAEAHHHHLTLEFFLPSEPLTVEADPLALTRVFTNLLHNALKFTPERGRVTICAKRQKRTLVVTVEDTGIGIAPENLPVVFEKYRQLRPTRHREGTGLGLFIAKVLAEAHGGWIEVESTLGVGSRFSVFLPLGSRTWGKI